MDMPANSSRGQLVQWKNTRFVKFRSERLWFETRRTPKIIFRRDKTNLHIGLTELQNCRNIYAITQPSRIKKAVVTSRLYERDVA